MPEINGTGKDNPEYVSWAAARTPTRPTAAQQDLAQAEVRLSALEAEERTVAAMSPELRDARARLRRLAEEQRSEREQAELDSQKRLASAHQHYLREINGAPTRRAS